MGIFYLNSTSIQEFHEIFVVDKLIFLISFQFFERLMPILFFFICCIKTLFIQIICGNLITYIQENLGRFQDLLTVSFYMHGTLRSIQNLCHWRSLFGIPIDLIHNTNQKIKANISKRAKFVLAYVYIYMYISSLHIKQWMHILIISMTCSLQRPKHCKITTFKNPPP